MQQGQNVRIIMAYFESEGDDKPAKELTGKIAGAGFINRGDSLDLVPVFMVDLTEGFYNPEKKLLRSILGRARG